MQHDLAEVLDHLSKDRRFFNGFEDNLLTRTEWSYVLGIDRTTLWRWEKDIIYKVAPIKTAYLSTDRGARTHYLDAYQRFLLTCIFIFKGYVAQGMKTNKQAITFLKINFNQLKREQFEAWRKDYV
ncbi:hypothetical protein [Nostoc parmelioides]|uniref:Uncharacterized protein n=1 Tax=Nostoc parmelioides FACHB-3921 TaxID=2692909 RepID=A0ABR8BLU0_9NOSO|nr:hypothetical protein [Nostoc parmelioides]MBD2254634.1 hypothetical protein [Nostoc parmelioides FACHB-3921]